MEIIDKCFLRTNLKLSNTVIHVHENSGGQMWNLKEKKKKKSFKETYSFVALSI